MRLFEGRDWSSRRRQVVHRIGHLVEDGLEIIDADHARRAFRKLLQPRFESLRARRLAVAHREMRRFVGF
jgi:hypothetical protein